MEDKQIIQLFCDRCEDAISCIAEKYDKYCFSIAHNILSDREDAEECVNDTWLKVWNSIPPTMPTYLRVFVGKIVRNLSFDKYRASHSVKRGGGEMPVVLDELAEVIAGSDDVEAEYERKELVETINEFLYSVSDRDRDIFVRRYFYVEDTERIARSHDITEKNVLMILSRVRSKLRTYLSEREYI